MVRKVYISLNDDGDDNDYSTIKRNSPHSSTNQLKFLNSGESKDDQVTYLKLWRELLWVQIREGKMVIAFSAAFIVSMLSSAARIGSVFTLKNMMATISNEKSTDDEDFRAISIFIFISLLAETLKFINRCIISNKATEISKNLSEDLLHNIIFASIHDWDTIIQIHQPQRALNEIYTSTKDLLALGFLETIPQVLQFFGVVICSFVLFGAPTGITFATFGLAYLITSALGGYFIIRKQLDFNNERNKLSRLYETMENQDTIKILGGEKYELNEAKQILATLKTTKNNAENWNNWIKFILNIVSTFGNFFMLYVTSAELLDEKTTFELSDFIAACIYFRLIQVPLAELSDNFSLLAQRTADYDNVRQILKIPNEALSAMKHLPTKQLGKGHVLGRKIEFRGVSFSYVGNPNKVIHNLTFTLLPGETLAIVGSSGSGKSTLFKLLLGQYQGYSGDILIDDIDLRTLDIAAWRKEIAIVSQQTAIFKEDTIKANASYGFFSSNGNLLAQSEQIRTTLTDLQLAPRLLDNVVDIAKEKMKPLSGGENQRLGIARSMFEEKSLYLFDEPTAALDAHIGHTILTHLSAVSKGATAFIISHHLLSTVSADKILFIERDSAHPDLPANVIGTHDWLMQNSKGYRDLFNIQTGDENYKNLFSANR